MDKGRDGNGWGQTLDVRVVTATAGVRPWMFEAWHQRLGSDPGCSNPSRWLSGRNSLEFARFRRVDAAVTANMT